MGYKPQECLENTINTMGTRTFEVHPTLSLDYSMFENSHIKFTHRNY